MNIIPAERIEKAIYLIRGQKIMLDRDLSLLYGVETRQLKRQVRRNIERFPEDFMFVLSKKEIDALVCHFGTPLRAYFGGANPYAFTEHGILMLSSVLKSKRAVQVNIHIMRTFAKLRYTLASHKAILTRIDEMESKYDNQFKAVFDSLRKLVEPVSVPAKKIGFLKDR